REGPRQPRFRRAAHRCKIRADGNADRGRAPPHRDAGAALRADRLAARSIDVGVRRRRAGVCADCCGRTAGLRGGGSAAAPGNGAAFHGGSYSNVETRSSDTEAPVTQAKRAGGAFWIIWIGLALGLVFVARQILVGDAAALIAHLWV